MIFRKHKYNAQRTIVDGISFPSKLEAAVYSHLKILQIAGEISDLKNKVTVRMTEANVRWAIDFSAYWPKEKTPIAIEAKGKETTPYKDKLRIYRVYGPYPLWIFKGTYQRPVLVEIVRPTVWERKRLSDEQ